jgi:hypothetical protein
MNLFEALTRTGFDRGYPQAMWDSQNALYREFNQHFSGTWMDETVSTTSETLKYPLKYNIFKLPVLMHTSFLFGEVPDGASALVQPEVELWKSGERSSTAQSAKESEKMTLFLQNLWDENFGRGKLALAALNSQVLGGCVLGSTYDPVKQLNGDTPISFQTVDPSTYYPVWSHNDYDRMLEVIVAYIITKIQAKELGVTLKSDFGLYYERWSRDKYEIMVEDQVVSWNTIKMSGATLANRIPYVYIPHPPRTSFYGESLLFQKLNLAKEVNARLVDVGDIVSDDASAMPAIINARNVEVKKAGGIRSYLDLGYAQGDRVPDIKYAPARGNSAQNAGQYVMQLNNLARAEAFCPPVVFGQDDGSQRSAASLALRAIPLIAHIREERSFFARGFGEVNKTALLIAAEKGIGGFSKESAQQARVRSNWYPMLPRDALEEVMSIITRVQAKILSPETAVEMIGDVIDISGEMAKIKEWINEETEQQLKAQPKPGASGEKAGLVSTQNTKEK